MKIIETSIPDLLIIEPDVFADQRGYFFEAYNEKKYQQAGMNYDFVQDNQSKSVYGVIRGLHYQLAPYAQTKLVRALEGEILDVAVDIRKGSPTFGHFEGVILSEENKRQLLIPRGFAHGFAVLSNSAVLFYKCDAFYNKQAERGIIYNDTSINIEWQIPPRKVILSGKDKKLPAFDAAEMNFKKE